jgi:uncharacterized membrane protein YeiH
MSLSADSLTEIIRFVDLAGVLANAILGGIAARSARLDIVGFIILAVMSGLGGGMIRDTLLQHGTPVALTDPAYLIVALVGGVIAFAIPLKGKISRRSLILLDALAVGCWAAAGAQKTLDAGLWWLPAIMLGVITAVGGGMVRDIMLLKVPTIFGGNTLYATSALVASIEMVVLSLLGFQAIGSAVAILSGALLSLLARRYGWILPTGLELRIPVPKLPRSLRGRRPRPRDDTDDD